MIQGPDRITDVMKTVEFGKWLYLIGDGLKKKKTDTRVCVVEKNDDLAFLEQ